MHHQKPVTVEEFGAFFDTLNYPACPVCGEDKWSLVTFDNEEAAVFSGHWHALICDQCGLTHFHGKRVVEQWRREHA
uniref:Uncharacterized protein n=1 Tax=Candidatus Kentrum sp. DK TaxID=2126562 RepID=A0A450TBX7_9GAMM|nr:MAG: hypothetical protein BECKDK2373C_GA0170839_11157 [Candidatus Kentron sp. DK]